LNAHLKYRLADLIHDAFPELTPRQVEVLVEVCLGKGNKKIAEDLGIRYRTVANFLWKIYGRINVRNRADLISQILIHVLEKNQSRDQIENTVAS